MGTLTLLAFLKFGLSLNFAFTTAIFGIVLLISLYALKHFIIPDAFLIFLLVLAFIYIFVSNFSIIHNPYFIFQNFLSGVVLALPFLLIFLISKGTWFGFGDVKYIAVLGFLLGFPSGLSAVVLAFWIGAVVAILAMVLKKVAPCLRLPLLKNNLTIKSEIPFGPFLSLGILVSLYFSLDLFHIYEFFNF
jgi:prepilin signal peptidase PulO-like enzyme (type II secretory pathway)